MKALELIIPNIDDNTKYIEKLNHKIVDNFKKYDNVYINSTDKSVMNTINISIKGIKPETFIHALEKEEIYVSTKSACSKSDSLSNSVYAVTKDKERAANTIRISLSYLTTEEEVDKFLEVFDECYNHLLLKRGNHENN